MDNCFHGYRDKVVDVFKRCKTFVWVVDLKFRHFTVTTMICNLQRRFQENKQITRSSASSASRSNTLSVNVVWFSKMVVTKFVLMILGELLFLYTVYVQVSGWDVLSPSLAKIWIYNFKIIFFYRFLSNHISETYNLRLKRQDITKYSMKVWKNDIKRNKKP